MAFAARPVALGTALVPPERFTELFEYNHFPFVPSIFDKPSSQLSTVLTSNALPVKITDPPIPLIKLLDGVTDIVVKRGQPDTVKS